MKKYRLTYGEIAAVCRSLGLLLHAGVGPADGLFLLAEDEGGDLGGLLRSMGNLMDGGASLSDAAGETGAFPAYVTGLLSVGERGGRTEETLMALAGHYEERDNFSRQLKNALTYPALLLLLMLVVIAVLLIKVLPIFDEVYASLGGGLTGLSGAMLRLGQVLKTAMPVLLAVLAAVVLFAAACFLIPGLGDRVKAASDRIWGDRGARRKFNNARFAGALAMGLAGGLSIEEAARMGLGLLEDVPAAAARCEECVKLLETGAAPAEALGSCGILSSSACRMLSVGIKGGSGDMAMEDIARRMMDEATEALETSASRAEPAMVLAASLLVGVILLAVMIPLLNVMSAIG